MKLVDSESQTKKGSAGRSGRAIVSIPSRPVAIEDIEIAMRRNDAKLAASLASQLVEAEPDHLPALELYSKALWKLGDAKQLRVVLNQLIRLNPYEPGYFSLLGMVEQSAGRIGLAIQAFTRSLRLSTQPDPSVVSMLDELRKYQTSLIADLLSADPIFRHHYERKPLEAARERGFEIEMPASEVRPQARLQAAALFARPC